MFSVVCGVDMEAICIVSAMQTQDETDALAMISCFDCRYNSTVARGCLLQDDRRISEARMDHFHGTGHGDTVIVWSAECLISHA